MHNLLDVMMFCYISKDKKVGNRFINWETVVSVDFPTKEPSLGSFLLTESEAFVKRLH